MRRRKHGSPRNHRFPIVPTELSASTILTNGKWTASKSEQLKSGKPGGEYPRQMTQNHQYFVRDEQEKRQRDEIRGLRGDRAQNLVPENRPKRKTNQ